MGMFGWLVVGILIGLWSYAQKRDRESERIRDEWHESQVKSWMARYQALGSQFNDLSARNAELEELIDTLQDERAEIRRWYGEAPKWMVDSYVKPE